MQYSKLWNSAIIAQFVTFRKNAAYTEESLLWVFCLLVWLSRTLGSKSHLLFSSANIRYGIVTKGDSCMDIKVPSRWNRKVYYAINYTTHDPWQRWEAWLIVKVSHACCIMSVTLKCKTAHRICMQHPHRFINRMFIDLTHNQLNRDVIYKEPVDSVIVANASPHFLSGMNKCCTWLELWKFCFAKDIPLSKMLDLNWDLDGRELSLTLPPLNPKHTEIMSQWPSIWVALASE